MKDIKNTIVIHPFLFAVSPILFLYSHNMDMISASSLFPPMGLSLCVLYILWFFFKRALNDNIKSGIIISLFYLMFFSYGYCYGFLLDSAIRQWGPKSGGLEVFISQTSGKLHILLILFFCLIGYRIIIQVMKTSLCLINATKILNLVAMTMVFFSLFNVGVFIYKGHGYSNMLDYKNDLTHKVQISEKRDIYYIILDGYGREDILKEFYNYDNSAFITFLQDKGFYVASKSCSNFIWSFLSLPSSLNFQYINLLSEIVGRNSRDRRTLYKMIEKNKTMLFLKSQGYRYIHFASTWGATLSNRFADIEISFKKCLFQNEFYRLLASTTFLRICNKSLKKDLASHHLYSFEKLKSMPELKGPKFIFIHVLPPHHPYLFDRNGNVKRYVTIAEQFEFHKHLWKQKEEYIEQLIFITKQMELTIKTILDKSDIPPIIIIQSDHGPTLEDVPFNEYIKARAGILNAYYLPGKTNFIYDTITPVNTFRLIFNHYFGTSYPLLPDETYHSSYNFPYKFTRIKIGQL